MEPMSLAFRDEAIEPLLVLAQRFFRNAQSAYGTLGSAEKQALQNLKPAVQCFNNNSIEGVELSFAEVATALKNQGGVKTLSKAHTAASLWAEQADINKFGITEFLKRLHSVFVSALPQNLRSLEGTTIHIEPGQFRTIDVQVGQHVPPRAVDVEGCIARFEEVYGPFLTRQMTGKDQLMAIIHGFIAHHRLTWIHPFSDFNGRISRIFLDKWLSVCLVPEMACWTIIEGLASDSGEQYKAMLHNADQPRHGALDGRGNLTEKGLVDFVRFALCSPNFMQR